jgi:hypothetical protein
MVMLDKAGKTVAHPLEAGRPRALDQYRKIKTPSGPGLQRPKE